MPRLNDIDTVMLSDSLEDAALDSRIEKKAEFKASFKRSGFGTDLIPTVEGVLNRKTCFVAWSSKLGKVTARTGRH
jgi:hypothetical protein